MTRIPVMLDERDHDHVIDLNPRPLRRTLLIAAAIGVIVTLASVTVARSMAAIEPPLSVSGIASIDRPGCASGAYKVSFQMVGEADRDLIGVRPLSLGIECQGVSYGLTTWYEGRFDPRVGGCLVASNGSRVCLGAIPYRGVHDPVRFDLCFAEVSCWPGRAALVRS